MCATREKGGTIRCRYRGRAKTIEDSLPDFEPRTEGNSPLHGDCPRSTGPSLAALHFLRLHRKQRASDFGRVEHWDRGTYRIYETDVTYGMAHPTGK